MARKTRRLPAHRGPAAWSEVLGAQPAALPALSENRTADLVIIGGGIAGLSAARRFLQLEPDAAVVLLEAGRLAEGAAGRNSGFMIDLPHDLASDDYAGGGNDRAVIALNRHAISFARDAVAEYLIDPSFFEEAGKVNGAASTAAETTAQGYARHLEALGETVEHMDAQAMTELTGSTYYRSGLYTPGTVLVQPAGYVRGLAAGLGSQMALHEKSAVTALGRAGPDWTVQTDAASVTSPRVIMATNGHLESFGYARGRLIHLFLFASMTEPLQPGALAGAPIWGVTPADPMGTTVRRIDGRQGGDRIVVRSAAVLRSDMTVRPEDLSAAANAHREKFNARFPELTDTAMAYSWAGQLCLSRNGVSVMRELDPGLFSACVQNGLGLTKGTLTGIGAAELAAGATSEVTRALSAEKRPKLLPPQPFRDLVGNAILRRKERQAAAE